MKTTKRGYRLTEQEEAILRGETPGETETEAKTETETAEDISPEQEPSGKKSHAVRALLPLLAMFGLMVGIAYLFVYLIGGQPEPAVDIPEVVISPEQKADFVEKLHLSAEEQTAFWPLYTRFCTEIETVRRERLLWLSKQKEKNPSDLPLEDFMETYTVDYKELSRTIQRYSEAFAALLGEERVPTVFLLFEEWQGENFR
ncbi:MAG: hypothetical protein LBM20_03435 [Rikenellaceae bacterium]|jgi:hypothetical protein|nr:hypothetical protein [Rikenellaceae bacterium]